MTVGMVRAALAAVGEKIARMRLREEERDDERNAPTVPPLVRAPLVNLRDVAAKRLDDDADTEAKIVDVLARGSGVKAHVSPRRANHYGLNRS